MSIRKTHRFAFKVFNSSLSVKQIDLENFRLKNDLRSFQSFKDFRNLKKYFLNF